MAEHRDRLVHHALSLCGSVDEAEDIVQDAFVRVLRASPMLRSESDLGYLHTTVRHMCTDVWRRRRITATVHLDDVDLHQVDEQADPGRHLLARLILHESILSLSSVFRTTILAVDVLGLSYEQAARALGTRPGTIMSRLHRARSQIENHLSLAKGRRAEELRRAPVESTAVMRLLAGEAPPPQGRHST